MIFQAVFDLLDISLKCNELFVYRRPPPCERFRTQATLRQFHASLSVSAHRLSLTAYSILVLTSPDAIGFSGARSLSCSPGRP
jgi:hypothetical protein